MIQCCRGLGVHIELSILGGIIYFVAIVRKVCGVGELTALLLLPAVRYSLFYWSKANGKSSGDDFLNVRN